MIDTLVFAFSRWGKYFGLVSVPGRVVGDVLNIMAVAGQATNVDIYLTNGGGQTDKQSITLPKNGKVSALVDVPSAKRIIIKSDQPLSVTQLTKSKDTYLYFVSTTSRSRQCENYSIPVIYNYVIDLSE